MLKPSKKHGQAGGRVALPAAASAPESHAPHKPRPRQIRMKQHFDPSHSSLWRSVRIIPVTTLRKNFLRHFSTLYARSPRPEQLPHVTIGSDDGGQSRRGEIGFVLQKTKKQPVGAHMNSGEPNADPRVIAPDVFGSVKRMFPSEAEEFRCWR